MSKIIVECRVPAAGICQDISIPFEKPLYDTGVLIKTLFSQVEGFSPDETTVFCDYKTGLVFDINLSPQELNMVNGSSLLLI